jgi:hypothetical protein
MTDLDTFRRERLLASGLLRDPAMPPLTLRPAAPMPPPARRSAAPPQPPRPAAKPRPARARRWETV